MARMNKQILKLEKADATQKQSGDLGVTQTDPQDGACRVSKSLSVCETESESSAVTLSRCSVL